MSGPDHGSTSDAAAPAASTHPVRLILGGFALLNGLVLGSALVIRRRPAARKRRAMLARVRSARTVPSAPAAEQQS